MTACLQLHLSWADFDISQLSLPPSSGPDMVGDDGLGETWGNEGLWRRSNHELVPASGIFPQLKNNPSGP
jgi:hypothetical protein